MKVIPELEAKTITRIVKEQLETSVVLTIGDSTSYISFDKLAGSHTAVTSGMEAVKTFLPWVHIAMRKAKRLLLDVHHKLKNEYLQYYLKEFCCKFNRRYFVENLFDRIVFTAIKYNTDFRCRIQNNPSGVYRTEYIGAKFFPEQKEHIRRLAQKCGMTVIDYLPARTSGYRPKARLTESQESVTETFDKVQLPQ